MEITTLRGMLWRQFGAAIDSLAIAIEACPDELWCDSIWEDPTDAPEYTQFWFVSYHAIVWADRYLSGSPQGFKPPAPFVAGALPEKPYPKDVLLAYLEECRQKAQAIFADMTDEKANQICKFPWDDEMSFAELQLYNMRHLQEHAAQFNLHLGQKTDFVPDWVTRAAG